MAERGPRTLAFGPMKPVGLDDPRPGALAKAERLGPNILSADHWARLLDGELLATSSRPDWALLMRRTFGTDLRTCAHCGGSLSIRAVITEPATIRRLLDDLHQPEARAPPGAAC